MGLSWQLKAFAIACITAGVARAVFSFVPWDSNNIYLEASALIIDLAVLFGLCAFYMTRHQKLKAPGFAGFTITAAGLALITGVDGQAFGIDVYSAGTLIIGFGLLVFSAALILAKLARIAAMMWIVMIAVQAMFFSLSMGEFGFTMAGVFFGLGFAALGWSSLQAPPEPVA